MVTTALADISHIRKKVEAGEPLSFDDGVRLYESPDIHTLGELANIVRERLHGRVAYYNINRHINYTNYCVLRCKFCSFYRPYAKRAEEQNSTRAAGFSPRDLREVNRAADGITITPPKPPLIKGGSNDERGASVTIPYQDAATDAPPYQGGVGGGQIATTPVEMVRAVGHGDEPYTASTDGGYELSIDEIVERAKDAYAQGATEVHIVGGLHPKLPFDYYLDMCRSIRDACPHMHIKAFTAIEIIHFTRITKPRLSIAEVLTQLRDAGLGSLPGGGAEIFDERVHDEAYKTKVGEAEWFEVHRTAHELGIFTNATMLYGHVETRAERVKHLIKLREHQCESLRSRRAHFNCVIPLSFIPDGSALSQLPGPSGVDDLKTLAIARLMCTNIPHIKAFWIMQTPKLAQVSLNWGVDDIDGTVVYYDITKREGGGTTHQELTVDTLKRLIVEAGCVPLERDTIYRRVNRDNHHWRIDGEAWSVRYARDGTSSLNPPRNTASESLIELSVDQ